MVNISSNNNRQTVILDCNNKYMRGTPIKKNLEESIIMVPSSHITNKKNICCTVSSEK